MPNRNTILRCGYLLPRVLLLWAILDLGLRFAPPQWYTFRLHEFAMITGPHAAGPFRTNLLYKNAHAYGDLAELSNCLECREYRPMNIHIDERGFANPASLRGYDAILVGDSFCIGAEQPEGKTLASQLSLRTGMSIYNACSPIRAIRREDLMSLIDHLGMRRGTVFFELMDWSLGFFQMAQQPPGYTGYDRWLKNLEYSPLTNVSREVVGKISNGKLMLNPYSANVVEKHLPDGHEMLFQLDDVHDASADGPKLWAKYFRVLDRELRARNFQLIVVLVPSKYTAYQPLIKGAAPTNKGTEFRELQKLLPDISVANTTPALQATAKDAFEHGSLLYWPDDTHWNADGVRVAADQVETVLAARRQTMPKAMVESVSEKQVH